MDRLRVSQFISIHITEWKGRGVRVIFKERVWHTGLTVEDAGGAMGVIVWNNYSCIVCLKKRKESTEKWMKEWSYRRNLKRNAWVQSFPCCFAIPWKMSWRPLRRKNEEKETTWKKLGPILPWIPYGSLCRMRMRERRSGMREGSCNVYGYKWWQ